MDKGTAMSQWKKSDWILSMFDSSGDKIDVKDWE